MYTTGSNLARVLRDGDSPVTFTTPYDGISAVKVDADGMMRSTLPIGAGDHRFALALEVGGRAMNLLHPYPGVCCAHGLVKRERAGHWQPSTSCDCGQEPISTNPPREHADARD